MTTYTLSLPRCLTTANAMGVVRITAHRPRPAVSRGVVLVATTRGRASALFRRRCLRVGDADREGPQASTVSSPSPFLEVFGGRSPLPLVGLALGARVGQGHRSWPRGTSGCPLATRPRPRARPAEPGCARRRPRVRRSTQRARRAAPGAGARTPGAGTAGARALHLRFPGAASSADGASLPHPGLQAFAYPLMMPAPRPLPSRAGRAGPPSPGPAFGFHGFHGFSQVFVSFDRLLPGS
jgi:hypothetical protein